MDHHWASSYCSALYCSCARYNFQVAARLFGCWADYIAKGYGAALKKLH